MHAMFYLNKFGGRTSSQNEPPRAAGLYGLPATCQCFSPRAATPCSKPRKRQATQAILSATASATSLPATTSLAAVFVVVCARAGVRGNAKVRCVSVRAATPR